LLGVFGRTVIQAGYFVVIARMLGASQFGVFAALVAIASILSPFVSLGTIQLVVRDVAQSVEKMGRQLEMAIAVTVMSGLALTVALTCLSPIIAPRHVAIWICFTVFAGEMIGYRTAEVCAYAFLGTRQMYRYAGTLTAFHAIRLVAVIITAIALDRITVAKWVPIYAGTSLVASVAILTHTARSVQARLSRDAARQGLARYRGQASAGILFSIGLASQTVYNDIDKAMLARLSTTTSAGLYTAAYRAVDVALAPIRAMMAAASPRFFAAGKAGVRPAARYAGRLAPACLGYAALSSVGLFLLAGILPSVVGHSFDSAVPALRGLAILPTLKAVQYLAADALTGAGKQGVRSVAQGVTALLNVGLNLAIIPRYSWRGAVGTSIACDALLAIGLLIVLATLFRNEQRSISQSTEPTSDTRSSVVPDELLPD
jgi:O-antigen/teichoic acid export membrane protein